MVFFCRPQVFVIVLALLVCKLKIRSASQQPYNQSCNRPFCFVITNPISNNQHRAHVRGNYGRQKAEDLINSKMVVFSLDKGQIFVMKKQDSHS
jgi:hypothetical protein